MAFAPDGRLFVCLQDGHLRVIDNNGVGIGLVEVYSFP
jgi:hypothetical protein